MTGGGWLLVAVLALPLLAATVLLVLPLDEPAARRLGVVVGAAVALLAVPAVLVGGEVDLPWIRPLDVRLHLLVDGVSGPLVLLTAALTALCLLYTVRVVPPQGRSRGLVGLVLLTETGMLGTFLAADLLLFFVAFEMVLVPMWFVIARWGDPAERPRASADTFVLVTLLGSVVMLLGLLVIRVNAGTGDMTALAEAHGAGIPRSAQLVAAVALVVGFGVKAPMWPLHGWLPDAHTAAPTVGSVLLAGVLLKMGTYGLVRILVPMVPEGAEVVAPWLGAFAVVGIVYGALACLVQWDLKRLIAYSSIGHMGFVLLGISTLTTVGINGALYANVAHGVITGLLFFLAGAIKDRHHSGHLAVLGGGLYRRLPRLGGLLGLAAIASIGLPGLAGFWGELLALLGAFDPAAGLPRPLYLVYLAGACLGLVLTTAYVARLLRMVGQGVPARRWLDAPLLGDAQRHELTVWLPVAAAVVVLGLWPGLLLGVSDPVVARLLGGGP